MNFDSLICFLLLPWVLTLVALVVMAGYGSRLKRLETVLQRIQTLLRPAFQAPAESGRATASGASASRGPMAAAENAGQEEALEPGVDPWPRLDVSDAAPPFEGLRRRREVAEPAAEEPVEWPETTAPFAAAAEGRPVEAVAAPWTLGDAARRAGIFDAKPASGAAKRRRRGPAEGAGAAVEAAIGQRWLVRAGALALLVGFGFLYKHSVDIGVLTPPLRLLLGAIVGAVLVGLGLRFQGRGYAALAQGFVAGGAAMFDLVLFAGHARFGLFEELPAAAGIAVVTAGTVAIALRWSAPPLAILAELGGFLVPILLWKTRGDATGLLAYVWILDLGFLVAASRKRWAVLNAIAVMGTVAFLMALDAAGSFRTGGVPAPGTQLAWYAGFSMLWIAGPLLLGWRRGAVETEDAALAGAVALPWVIVTHALVAGEAPSPYGLVPAGIASFLALVAEVVVRRWPASSRLREVLRAAAALGVVSMAATSLAPLGTTLLFAAAIVLLAALARTRLSVAWLGGAALASLVGVCRVLVRHLAHSSGPLHATPFWNVDVACSGGIVLSLALAGVLARNARLHFGLASALLGIVVLLVEVQAALLRTVAPPSLAAATAISRILIGAAAALAFAHLAARTEPRRLFSGLAAGFAAAAAMVLVGATVHLQRPSAPFLLNPLALTLVLFPVPLLAVRAALGPAPRERWTDLIRSGLEAAAVVLPLLPLSVEAFRAFAGTGPGVVRDAGNAAVSATWALYAALLLVLGIVRRLAAVRYAALALLGLTLFKVVAHDLAALDTVARIVSFLVLGVVLMAGGWIYHRFETRLRIQTPPGSPELPPGGTPSETSPTEAPPLAPVAPGSFVPESSSREAAAEPTTEPPRSSA